MGENIYTAYWKSFLPNIINQLKTGGNLVRLNVTKLSEYGEREKLKGYDTSFVINNAILENPENAHAHGRDLFAVLQEDNFFKDFLPKRSIKVKVENYVLTMEVTSADEFPFFDDQDFIELSRFTKQTMDNGNPKHKATYEVLKNTYAKHEYWAREVQKKIFPNGSVQIRKRPTNQANKFEEYQWAKIYPDKASLQYTALAFTIGIDTDYRFTIKIDTISLPETDSRRQAYLEIRGDYDNSAIVKHLPEDQVLDKGWKYLIDLTSDIILTLKPQFDSLLKSFQGNIQTTAIQPPLKNNTAMALNTILYGPPGTGKTYTTINSALEIIGYDFIGKARRTIKRDFDEYVTNGQIVFTTFHQSMSYEDFIEGIKPKTVDSLVQYEIEDGIFKRICDKARYTAGNFEIVLEKFKQDISEEDGKSAITINAPGTSFDIIFRGTNVFYVQPHSSVKVNAWYPVNINNIRKAFETDSYDGLYNPTYIREALNYLKKKYDLKKANKPEENIKNYVLIIDEINRGNVSQVFGELITLIEEDKREGANEELQIQLPYSKQAFSVPKNLYIIGTMNTADRSVEALDTALRRRFAFKEMMPQPALLHPKQMLCNFWNSDEHLEIEYDGWMKEPYKSRTDAFYELIGMSRELETRILDTDFTSERLDWFIEDLDEVGDNEFTGIRLEKMLQKINERLEAILTKDHTIGHAWLMKVHSLEDLQGAFKNKILPLLQEFFYNDYAKIGLVLGDVFVLQKSVGKSLFSNFKDNSELASDYEDKVIYTLANTADIDLDGFKSIYK